MCFSLVDIDQRCKLISHQYNLFSDAAVKIDNVFLLMFLRQKACVRQQNKNATTTNITIGYFKKESTRLLSMIENEWDIHERSICEDIRDGRRGKMDP